VDANRPNQGSQRGQIGKTLTWARKRAGLTQHDLARAVGMPQSSIARIERGTVSPRTATLIALLKATGHQLSVEPIDHEVDRAPAMLRAIEETLPQR
jgi:transcriptional regulator with XRE-family HTH domain